MKYTQLSLHCSKHQSIVYFEIIALNSEVYIDAIYTKHMPGGLVTVNVMFTYGSIFKKIPACVQIK